MELNNDKPTLQERMKAQIKTRPVEKTEQKEIKEKLSYVFFIRETEFPTNPYTGELYTYENYLKGGCDREKCRLMKLDFDMVNKMLTNLSHKIFKHIECVEVPTHEKSRVNGILRPISVGYSIEEVNELLKQ